MFTFRYFFHVLCTAIVLNLLNVFCFYPVLLCLIGPACEVETVGKEPYLPLSKPPPSPLLNQRLLDQQRRPQPKMFYLNHKERRSSLRRTQVAIETSTAANDASNNRPSSECRNGSNNSTLRKAFSRAHSQISLSTISEEPHDYSSSRENLPRTYPEIIVPQLILETTTTSNAFYPPPYFRPGTGCNTPNSEVNVSCN